MDILSYILHLLIIFSIYLTLALAGNLSLGFGGLFNLAFVGLALIGAYFSALLTLKAGLTFGLSFALSLAIGYLMGWLISKATAKLKGDYLALVTFGFGFVVFTIALNWEKLTRGALGLPGIPKPDFGILKISELWQFLVLYGLFVLIVYLLLEKLINSPLGRVIKGLRDDELAITVLSRSPIKIKNLVLGLSGLLSALAGILYAHYITYLDPYSFGLGDLIFILSAVFLGGLAENKGTFWGTLVLVFIPEVLRFLPIPSSLIGPLRQIIYSLIIILILWLKPKGIFGKLVLD
jgi:branched-chain amino acid transport system permease protein